MRTDSFLVGLFALFLIAGCAVTESGDAGRSNAAPAAVFSSEQLNQAIILEAKKYDHTVVDGWYYGQEPRIFKSAYYKLTPERKARFALAYHQWLEQSGQNMLANWKSYVPYSKRSQYARQWFTENEQDFAKETAKMKVVWIHEALLDGSELWWRAYEQLSSGAVQSPATLAHDAEQELVFKYAEGEGNEGSLSTQPMPM